MPAGLERPDDVRFEIAFDELAAGDVHGHLQRADR